MVLKILLPVNVCSYTHLNSTLFTDGCLWRRGKINPNEITIEQLGDNQKFLVWKYFPI